MENDSALILMAPPSGMQDQDIHYPYKNSSDLLYLTGIQQENIALIISSNGQKYIFAEEYSSRRERWEGKRLTPQEIAQVLSFDKEDRAFFYSSFWEKASEILVNKKILYWNFSETPENHTKIFSLLNRLNANPRGKRSSPLMIKHSGLILHEMRLFKEDSEIDLMRKTAQISGNAHISLINYSGSKRSDKNEIYEYELRAFLESEFFKSGSETLAYPSIVAGGENATILHYAKCNDPIKSGSLVLVDAGCKYKGYASDITRTFPISGEFTQAQKEIYSIVLAAQKNALKECKPNSNLKKIHDAAVRTLTDGLWELGFFKKCIQEEKNKRFTFVTPNSRKEVIERKYYLPFYMHHTSHFLGMDVHDVGDYFIKKKHRSLKTGMIFTVEPGLYFPNIYKHIPKKFRGIGIRIEDEILITKNGFENLSQLVPKEIKDIEELAGAAYPS